MCVVLKLVRKGRRTHIACYIWSIGLLYIAFSVLYMLQQKATTARVTAALYPYKGYLVLVKVSSCIDEILIGVVQ